MICVSKVHLEVYWFFDSSTNSFYLDDPELFSTQPVCLQVVGYPYQDEELVAVSEILDQVVNKQ